MFKYEFIYKVRPYPHAHSYKVKYRCVVEEKRFNLQKTMYEKVAANHKEEDPIILINKLTDDGEFVEVIQ